MVTLNLIHLKQFNHTRIQSEILPRAREVSAMLYKAYKGITMLVESTCKA